MWTAPIIIILALFWKTFRNHFWLSNNLILDLIVLKSISNFVFDLIYYISLRQPPPANTKKLELEEPWPESKKSHGVLGKALSETWIPHTW